jgi:hypothetical protein
MAQESIVRLKFDLAVALALLFVAKAGRPGRPNPDVCYYLGVRYFHLAEHYRRGRRFKKANRLRRKAKFYLAGRGPAPEPPYAAAMAMPAPERPTFVSAIGWRARKGPPKGAA